MKLQVVLALALFETAIADESPSSLLEQVGKRISLPFPNEHRILGIGGLGYDSVFNSWLASSENIASATSHPGNEEDLALPRIFHMDLDFQKGRIDFILEESIVVQPKEFLKLEDLAILPDNFSRNTTDRLHQSIWLASESHSHQAQTSKFFSKDFGPTDLTSFDRETFSSSRLVRINGATGEILEEASLPEYVYWDMVFDWESTECIGERPFAGLHALSIVEPSRENKFYGLYDKLMFAAYQAALYQDGSSPTDFSESSTRILLFGLNDLKGEDEKDNNTASYLTSFRYDTSKLSLNSNQKDSSHFNALFAILALDDRSLLVAECEDLTGVGKAGQKIVNRIYYVEIDFDESVDHCHSLLYCDVDAPSKRLVWEQEGDSQLDGMSWGPILDNGRRTVALSFENDDKVGVHFELYAIDEETLTNGNQIGIVYDPVDYRDILMRNRIIAVSVASGLLVLIFILQFVGIRYLQNRKKSKNDFEVIDADNKEKTTRTLSLTFANYALATAMMNSFVVGGLTFGYSGMVLMLRKEGVYAEFCSCGSFCAMQKEQLALISTLGFSTAVGSRLFVGLFMDVQGPKLTALICSTICLAGFSILAASQSESLSSTFLPAWILLSLGGSGLHITGFHFTSLFPGDGKKKASAMISAAFGASSAVFPIMQIFNQFLGVTMVSMMRFYTFLVSLIVINNFLVQPWSKVKKGEDFKPSFNFVKKTWWKRDFGQRPTLSSIKRDVVKFNFFGEAMIFSILLFFLTHYLSTSSQLMYEKGDIPFTSRPNDWSDFMIARMAGIFNAIGFIWLPTVKYALTSLQWYQSYSILCILNLIVMAIVLLRSLEIQILGFAMLSFGRLMLFSCHHAYLIDVFGITSFGTLNGISSFIAASVGLCSYPLQLFALQSSYAIAFLPIGVLLLLSLFVPFLMWKEHKKSKELSRGTSGDFETEEIDRCDKNTVMNWAETVSVDPNTFRYPETVDEVIALVTSHKKIRCAGALHSCAPLIKSEGIIMSLTKLEKIIHIDPQNMTVRCQAGARIHDICTAIAPYNMAMGTMGTIDWQTISGAVMTGTHGGALSIPSMHAFINSYTLVKPDGSMVTITKEKDPTLFSAMAPSMGVFGCVVELEVQCVPLEILEAKLKMVEFADLEDTFEDYMRQHKYVRVVVYPSIGKATVFTGNPVASRADAIKRGAIDSPGYANFRNKKEKQMLEQYLELCNVGDYDKADEVLEGVLDSQLGRMHHYVGQYNHVLCKERNNGIPHADIEFNFDMEKNKEVLRTVKEYSDKKRMPYYNFEIRTTKRDDAMLSCCQGRDAMWIDFQAKADVSREFFGEMEEILKPIGFRKHWAKGMDNTDPEYVLRQFSQVRKFLSLMTEIDPEGKFRNTQSEGWFRMMDSAIANENREEVVEC